MYVLVVREADGNETEYDLAGEVVLGRDDSADIRLGDGNVSRQHARVFVEDDLCYLEDLGSANGTSVAGNPVVGAVVLAAGQEAVIGPFTLWVEDPDGEVNAVPGTVAGAPALGGDTFNGPAPTAEGAPSFEGLGGVAYGQQWSLGTRNSVGRVEGNTIVLPDPSISRNHAEVILRGEEIIVRDLGSSNGTFVNDQPITQQAAFEGDIVRFGDVEVQVKVGEGMAMPHAAGGGGAPAIRPGARSARRGSTGGDGRKKLLLVGGTVVVAIIAIAAVLKPKAKPAGPKPSQNGVVGPSRQTSVQEQTFKLMRQGQAQIDSKQWATAEKLYAQVVELDPINKAAREKLREVRLEKKMAQRYQDATSKRDLGDDQTALDIYTDIDPKSTYHSQAVYAVANLIPNMLKKYRGECLGLYKAHRYREALEVCRQHEDLACQCSEFENKLVSRYMRDAERVQHVAAAERWRCPVKLAAWVPCAVGPKGDCEGAVQKRYPSKRIAAAMELYCQGKALKAMGALKKIVDRYSDPDRDQAVDLSSAMKIVEGKWKEGTALILKGDPEEAQRVWDSMLASDGRIVPTDTESWYPREAHRELQKAYHDKGQDQMNRERYVDAFGWAMKGMAVGNGSPELKLLIQRLEKQGTVEVRRAVSCAEFQRILGMTRADPPSPTHQEALRKAQQRGCQ